MDDPKELKANTANKSQPAYFLVQNAAADDWWKDAGLRVNVWHCLGLCGVTFMNGYDGSLMNGLQAMEQWQSFLKHHSDSTLGLISASLYLPAIVFSWVADGISARYGRRPAIWAGSGIAIIGAMINAAAVNVAMYAGGRVVEG
ncbi:hypothetical protein BDV19DRAFT_393089 [Aspergillus venezuelensis]